MAIYYVRPDGNNNNNGSAADVVHAWATITKAAQIMVAGDTVYIAPGTYDEQVTPSRSGTSETVRISFIGDPWCQYFTDTQMGDVVITSTSGGKHGFYLTSSYISIQNITFENYAQANYRCITNDTSTITSIEVINITAVKNILWFMSLSGASHRITRSVIKAHVALYAGNVTVQECIITGNIQGAGIMQHCYHRGNAKGSSMAMNGCLVDAVYMNDSFSMHEFYIPSLNARGSTFNAFGVDAACITGGGTVYGCSFLGPMYNAFFSKGLGVSILYSEFISIRDYAILIQEATGIVTKSYFSGCQNAGGVLNGISLTLNDCRFFYVPMNSAQANNNPVYGEIEEGRYMGWFATSQNPISGTKSLKFKGCEYAPVYIQWIPCEAGKAKTVKLKAKRNSANVSYLPKLVFGTSEEVMANDTNIQEISITYTHYKTELVPLMICGRVDSSGEDFFLVDDIVA